jgi:RND family efflux transporter MFP subunit
MERFLDQVKAWGLAVVALTVCGCRSAPPSTAALPPAEVTVSRPLVQEVTDSLEYTGSTVALAAVDVRSRVTGFLEKMHFEPRQRVRAGDVLFTIDVRPFQSALDRAIADQESKQAQLVKAEFNADKVQALFREGNAAPDELTRETSDRDMVRAALAASKAAVEQAKLERDWCQVTAPISGRVSRNLVDVGNIVLADQTVLANMVNDDSVFAYFNISERDALTIRERTLAEAAASSGGTAVSQPELRARQWPVYMALMTERGYPHVGILDYSAPQVDASTGTVQIRGVFDNPAGRLLAGLFVRLRVPIGKPRQALRVTERALGSDQGQRYLLVVNDKNVVEYRPVNIGSLQEGLRVIDSGVTANDWVIVNGIQRVRPGVTVKPIQAPMPALPQATSAPSPASNAATASGDSPRK